jgi:hypothetical protein
MLTSFLGHGDRCFEFGSTIRPVQLSGSPQPASAPGEGNPPEPETAASAFIDSKIAKVNFIAVLEFVVFA